MNIVFKCFKRILAAILLVIGNSLYAQNTTISGANTFSITLCSDGSVYTWGRNDRAQMALPIDGTIYSTPTKVKAGLLPLIKAVDAGSGSTAYALDLTGRVWSWGENSFGQTGTAAPCGIGCGISTPATVKLPNGTELTNVVSMNGGNQSAFALLGDGTVMAWGNNSTAQLGRGSIVGYDVRNVMIDASTNLTNIIQIDAFDDGCIALDKDGFVWTWGPAVDGQLGNLNYGYFAQKVDVLNNTDGIHLSGIVEISAGDKHGLAIDDLGYLWSWGANWSPGQLGRGTGNVSQVTYANRVLANDVFSTCPSFDQVGNYLTNVKDIAAGQASSIALLGDGTVVSWGAANFFSNTTNCGILGQGPAQSTLSCPKSVYKNSTTKLTNIVSISDGDAWYYAKDASGTVWCWGANHWYENTYSGFLGLGASVTVDEFYAIANLNIPTGCYVYPTCSKLSISGLPSIVCQTDTKTYPLTGTPVGGTFSGPGMSGNIFNAASLSTGIYTITYTYTSVPLFCPTSVSVEVYVPPLAQPLQNVISINATTYNDAWPSDGQVKSPPSDLYYLSGIKGSWIPEDQYAYVDDRQQASTLNTRTDGLMQNVAMYNWNYTTNGICYPNWRRVNTITQVANGTGQLENKDILKNYSAALYGYGDQLSLAVAANAEHQEICYEGFEEYLPAQTLSIWGLSKGNLTILNTQPTTTDLNKDIHFAYEVTQGINNTAIINYPGSRAADLINKSVLIFGASMALNTVKNINGYNTITNATTGTDPNTCNIVLSSADFKFQGYWNGKVSIPLNLSAITPVFNYSSLIGIVNSFTTDASRKAHTGSQFMKVTANAEFEQINMRLLAGQNYVFSTWLSADDVNASTYDLTGRGISINFMDKNGTPVGTPVTFTLTTSGNIIEGWQRLEGQFTFPLNAVRYTIKFLTPTGISTYYDDIRVFPADGNIQTYVYNNSNYKLNAVLDQNNYATYYYYDESGSLYLMKKETERGVMTIQESYSHVTEINK
jgi:alpha-tubulin suppressor-like RCC1 family protein